MKEIISISILSIFLYICFKLMLQSIQIDYKENLTMDKKPIKITIENYKDQTIQFIMPPDIPMSILRGHDSDRFNYLSIAAVGGDKYTIEEEQF